jgi:hypothetical protein
MAREATAYQANPPTTSVGPMATGNGEQVVAPKKKRTRSASPPRPAFFIVQVLDENGQPIAFDKRRIRIVSVERSAEKVLELVEAGNHEYAFYLRGIVPAGRSAAPKPAAA